MTHKWLILFIIINLNYRIKCSDTEEFCDNEEGACEDKGAQYRYLLYDVNPSEGFNLRRDVYLRFAVFARNLRTSANPNLNKFKLVLPLWSNLYHWQSEEAEQLPWSHFFDLESLQRFAPVSEMYQFFDEIGMRYTRLKIDEVYVLQHFEDMFESGQFEDRMEIQKCSSETKTTLFYYNNVTSDNVRCLSFHGHATQLSIILDKSSARTVLFDRGEVVLHDRFGDRIYWQARRSMRFNEELRNAAAEFREKYLNSTDTLDGTELPDDWRDEKPKREAKGGLYLSVHLRRRDFVRARPNDVPSITGAAQQIKRLLTELNLSKVFIATDAPNSEYNKLEELLTPGFEMYRFLADKSARRKYGKGGLAIIDQIICSHARHFVGTHESTFSFRIQEEREIMGFPIKATFNRLCGDDSSNCEKASVWTIAY